MSNIIFLSKPGEYSFEADWFDQATENNFWMVWRFRFLAKQLLNIGSFIDLYNKNLVVAEVGSGSGVLRRQLEELYPWNVDAIDIDLSALKSGYQGRGVSYYYNIHDMEPKLKGRYDVIFLFDVIEHIDDPIGFLMDVKEHLKDTGLLILNVPSCPKLSSLYDEAVGHRRRYSKKTMGSELDAAGFELIQSSYWGFLLMPALFIRRFRMGPPKKIQAIDKKKIIQIGWHPSKILNAFFKFLMHLELRIVKSPACGSSLMSIYKKSK